MKLYNIFQIRLWKFLVLLLFFANSANALNVIRDDEIESAIKKISKPIFLAAKRNPNDIKFYIIQDSSLNAFTAGGMSIFLNSGLISKFDDPSILQGVIAHEYGHILAGHVVQRMGEMRDAQKAWALSNFLGIIGAIATGSGDVAMAAAVGSSGYVQNKLLAYSRTHESEADHIALDLLYKAHYSNHGLLELLQILSKGDSHINVPTYFLTHPTGQWRINHIRSFSKQYPSIETKQFTDEEKAEFHLAIVKLRAFINNPKEVLNKKYNNEVDQLYSHAIANYRLRKSKDALQDLAKLSVLSPNNPYYYELAGQIYFENGNFQESVENYKKAFAMKPDSELIKYQLAVAYVQLAIQSKNNDLYLDAITLFKQIIYTGEVNELIWHYLSICYGKIGNFGMARLCMAEKSIILSNENQARKFAQQAYELLKKQNNEDSLRAQEIMNL